MTAFRTVFDKPGQLPNFGDCIPNTICRGPLQEAMDEVMRGLQVPFAMASMAVLSAVSFSIQSWTSIKLPNGQEVRASIFCLALGKPGEGKSGAVNVAYGPITDWIQEHQERNREEESVYQAKLHIWEARRKALLRKSVKSPDDESIVADYHFHLSNEPKRTPQVVRIIGDITPEAFISISDELGLESIASVSGEAGEIFSSPAARAQTMYNNAWSDDPIQSDRKGSGQIQVNPALTIYWSPQPEVMADFMEKAGRKAKGNGLWSRFLFADPESTQGMRDVYAKASSPPENYRKMLEKGMQKTIDTAQDKECEKVITELSSEAALRWLAMKESIQIELQPSGRFYGFEDHAAKLPINIVKVAMIFHYSEFGPGGEISLNTLNNAIKYCFKCSDDYVRYFAERSQEDIDAEALFKYLETRYNAGVRYVKRNHVMQYGPNRLRNAERLGLAISILSNCGFISVKQPNKTTVIDLYPGEHDDANRYQLDISQ